MTRPNYQIGPLELLVFQGTPFCNIDCSYCYLPDRLNKNRMSLDIVRQTMVNLVKDKVIRDDFVVLWHSGEPLVMPVAYYEEAIQIIRREVPMKYRIQFTIQTNGTLLSEEWCRFFKKYHVEVGMSIDGPELIHDRNRITRSGKGTLSKTLQGARLMKKHGLKLDILCVLTAIGCNYPEIMYEFFKEIEADSIGFNVEEVIGVNTGSSFSSAKAAKEMVKAFLKKFFQLNLQDGEALQIREYSWAKETVTCSNLKPRNLIFGQVTGPFKTVAVSTQGNFSTFSPELNGQQSQRYGDFVLGNVMTDSFANSIHSEKFKLMYGDLVKGLKKCKENCGYYGLCAGGVPSTKVGEHQTFDADETLYCQMGLQAPIDTLLEMVSEEQKRAVEAAL